LSAGIEKMGTAAHLSTFPIRCGGERIGGSGCEQQHRKFVGQYGVMTEPNGFYYMRARY
jgi:hypothetical protein